MPSSAESRRGLRTSRIKAADLVPGTLFEYRVWGETGPYGDFPGFKFRQRASWLVVASVIELTEIGPRTMFNVIPGFPAETDYLMTVEGVILPRLSSPEAPAGHFGRHPVQEGYATRLGRVLIDTKRSLGGRRVIPARNINKGSLRVIEEAGISKQEIVE